MNVFLCWIAYGQFGYAERDQHIRARASPRFFFIGEDECIGRHPNPPTPKIQFLLGFRSLYFENVGKCKTYERVEEKVKELS